MYILLNMRFVSIGYNQPVDVIPIVYGQSGVVSKGSPTVAKSRTLYLKSHLKSLKSLKFQNLKSRKVETVISKFLYISASN